MIKIIDENCIQFIEAKILPDVYFIVMELCHYNLEKYMLNYYRNGMDEKIAF